MILDNYPSGRTLANDPFKRFLASAVRGWEGSVAMSPTFLTSIICKTDLRTPHQRLRTPHSSFEPHTTGSEPHYNAVVLDRSSLYKSSIIILDRYDMIDCRDGCSCVVFELRTPCGIPAQCTFQKANHS